MVLVQKELQNAYIGEWVDVTSLTLDKSSITLTTVWQTEQITATTVPAWATVNWSSSDTTVATVSSSWLVTCVTPWECTITAESYGVTATCEVTDVSWYRYIRWNINANRWNIAEMQVSEFEICDGNGTKMSRPSWTSITCNYSYSDMQNYWPQKLIDWNLNTKWFVAYSTWIVLTIDLGTGIDIGTYYKYKWYTADDYNKRDPITWTLEISSDWNNWTTVSTITNATITTSRKALAWTWDMII